MNILEEKLGTSFSGSYSGLLALSNLPLVLLDADGHMSYEFNPLPEFCKCICPEGRYGSCAEFAKKADDLPEEGKLVECSCGLKLFFAPVKFDDEQAAIVSGGYVFSLEDGYRKYLLDVGKLASQCGEALKTVANACAALRAEPHERLENHEHLCRYMAQNISQRLQGAPQPIQSVEKDVLERRIIRQQSGGEIAVNPTFLFNMLNCIARTAYFEHAEKTENLIYCLSDVLRFNSQRGTNVHTIAAELEHIEKYLIIQKTRFQSRLKYSIDVSEHIRSCHILNSVLLPVVENALIHGVLLRKDGGEIRIKGETSGESIVLYIIDNGYGFSPEVLRTIKGDDDSRGKQGEILRINRSLKEYYGKEYGVEVVRSGEGGSTVSVRIPKTRTMR